MAYASSSSPQWKYDVFLSFKGSDTRHGFVSHLFNALCREKITVFKDENLDRGEDISPALLATIKQSNISLVIFSENYAFSAWCLDELVNILGCKKTMGQIVVPIFYHVDPFDIQKLTGSFGDAILMYREVFKDYIDKVESWSRALTETAKMTGFVSWNIKSECKLVDEIVNHVLQKLSYMCANDSNHYGLVGIDSRVKKVESLLCLELADHTRLVGIWGIGGIGKTETAQNVYNRIVDKFDGQCFIANVREELNKHTPSHLRDEILRKILGSENIRRLRHKKVLIVLDDVDNARQLKHLVGDCSLYGLGSRIIITSRDRQVLRNVTDDQYIYEVEKLIDDEAIQLFSFHAFRQNCPKEGYMELSKRAIRYAEGIPLALIVLGSNLYGKLVKEWKSEFAKLEDAPNNEIQKVLRISYDGVDEKEKNIFLDVACFLKGEDKDRVVSILDGCGYFPEIGISRLIDKSLITVACDNRLWMHDLLQELGKSIVREECIKEPGKRSRLWDSKDIYNVLARAKGTEVVEGISSDMSKIRYMELNSTAFMKMYNLKFLKLYTLSSSKEMNVHLPYGLEFLPDELRYLHWDQYPLKYLPSNFNPENLIELHLLYSHVEHLWHENKYLKNLKFMDLSNSVELISIPDTAQFPKLEVLILHGCTKLMNLPSSFGNLKYLQTLDLEGCINLSSRPESISNLKSLKSLQVTGCLNLTGFPYILGKLKSLEGLYAAKSGIKKLPPSINQLSKLKYLNCGGCKGLMLPHLTGLSCVKEVCLEDCGLNEIPSSLGSLVSIEEIYLGGNDFESIPESIKLLQMLRVLNVRDCKRLRRLPELPSCLQCLDASNCTSLKLVSNSFSRQDEVLWLWLDFCNCRSLDKNACEKVMEDQLLMFQQLALRINCMKKHPLNKVYQKCHGEKFTFEDMLSVVESVELGPSWLCIAGNEVPQSMRYQCKSGSSLSLTLNTPDPHDHISVAFCVVVKPKLFHSCEFDHIECRYYLVADSGQSFYFECCYPNGWNEVKAQETMYQSEHVLLRHSSILLKSKCRFSKASFQFFAKDKGVDSCEAVIKCGVNLLLDDYHPQNWICWRAMNHITKGKASFKGLEG